jgi:glycogen debranching enzyme
MRPVVLLFAAALVLAACGEATEMRLVGGGPQALADLAVEVGQEAEADSLEPARATFQTDKAGAVWYDALAAPQDDPAMGFTVSGARVLDGWRWWSDADSLQLGPADRQRGVARPDFAVRAYVRQDSSGFLAKLLALIRPSSQARLTERVTVLDGRGALLVEVADSIGTVGFRPIRSDAEAPAAYRVQDLDGTLVFARADQLTTDSLAVPQGPIWTAVAAEGGTVRAAAAAADAPEAGRRVASRLGEIALPTPGRLVVATGATPAAAAAAARTALADADTLRAQRSRRMAAHLLAIPFDTEDDTYDTAFRWALLSLDALLVADSSGARLAAGLPGAEPATFPSTMWTVGALLGTGQWPLARRLLATTGTTQRFDRRLDVLGRAPDLVPPTGDPAFRNADGTPLFLAAAARYVRTTGDQSLVRGGPNLWFKTSFALRGLYEPDARNGNPTDSLGFLATRDGRGTWLDTDPARGGAARRGATIEGQAALWQALGAATDFARIMGVGQRAGSAWYADSARALVQAVERDFVRENALADRLGADGRAETAAGPNALLAMALMPALLPDRRAQIARGLADVLVYPHGVGTRAQSDSAFHPFLTAGATYPREAARSGGAVWTWLAGPVATLMAETGGAQPAADLLGAQAGLVLDRGVVGALPELLAAHPRAQGGAPEMGGAPVQPWSLATFVEATVTGLLGARYASADTLVLEPRLPERFGVTTTRLRLGTGTVGLRLAPSADGLELRLTPEGPFAPGAALRVRAHGAEAVVPLAAADSSLTLVLSGGTAMLGGQAVSATAVPPAPAAWDGFAFVEPNLDAPAYAALGGDGEAQRTLTRAQVTAQNPRARPVLTRTDPQGDDWGATGTFTYPPGIPAGVLDGTYLEVSRDDTTTYFRAEFAALVPPGELGHSATFAAFVISTRPGGSSSVERNARYDFDDDGYEYVLFVGDGLLLEDADGNELARVPPGEEPLFDAETGTLAIAIPTSVLPALAAQTRVTLLIGALDPDDIGAFRSVTRQPTDDTGGGKVDARSPNVYDVIVGSTR